MNNFFINQYLIDNSLIFSKTISQLNRIYNTWTKCNGYYKTKDVCDYFLWNNDKLYSIINNESFRNIVQHKSQSKYTYIYNLFVPIKKFISEHNFKQVLLNYKNVLLIINNIIEKEEA